MSSTVQLDITHLTLPPINLTADDVQAKFVTFKGSFQQEVPGRDFVRLWVSGWKSAREVSEETLMGGFGGWVSPPANED
ncbi:hypothetical protein Pmani_030102 [Petrolisthes manimaculis]|uniref:Uncharacterized protein n=1 Tax=Petrolisthes manimaculis TaxID=1843537 RepID=A0AAE1NY68_9EUCA|nr:hypothetical protein Pmani_030102 [Petrolisthes manimaculis]